MSDELATKREGSQPVRTIVSRTLAPADERLTRGALVGRYVVIDELGAGGMGVVYSAFDPELDRKVAIKLLQAMPGGSESGGQTWLLREAQAMARLAHPNVVTVFDVGAIPGDRVFLAMELVEGTSLRQWLKDQPRTWREVLSVMRAAGAGLAAAHAAGLIHRDFKPDNVIVGADGRTRVMDFGLARLHGAADDLAARDSDLSIETRSPLSERLTEAGAVLGTPAYMAPEVLRGDGADTRADQFAFGVALYEALYRVRPFDRKALLEKRAVPPKPPASKVPPWLERIVLRAIALDPEQRFASMDALLVELSRDPSAARRQLVISAAFAIGCAGLIVGAVAIRHHGTAHDELCTDAPAKLATAWAAPQRAALEQAFRAFAVSEDSIRATETLLDRYADHWAEMRTEACRATRVLGVQADDVMTLRMACLDTRLVELGTLATLFGKADAALANGAVTSVQKLESLADCADVAALRTPDPVPKDPDQRRELAALQVKLAEAKATYLASQLKPAFAMVEAIRPAVMRIGHLPTIAKLRTLAGSCLWSLEGAPKGEAELLQGVWAAEAGKADQQKVETWLQLTNIANDQAHFEVAQERLEQTQASLARLGDNWELHVKLLESRAILLSRMNKYDEALAVVKQARAIADQHPDSLQYSYSLIVEASLLTSAGRAKDAIGDFKKVLAYQDGLGHNRVDVSVTLAGLATAENEIGQTADALAHAKSALAINTVIYGPETEDVARATSYVGSIQSTTDLPGALETLKRALALFAKTVGTQDSQYATVLGEIAEVLTELDRPREALPYLDEALPIQIAKMGAAHVQTLTVELTKCDAQRALHDVAGALATCSAALATAEQAFGKTNALLFLFLSKTASVLTEANKPREAVALYERALAIGANNPADLDSILINEAHALWAAGEHARAIAAAVKARDGYRGLGEVTVKQAHAVDEWLASHH